MKIKRLYINNYKSLVDFELIEPNPFSVFVGPNAAGKSNIFEALEFLSYWLSTPSFTPNLFNGPSSFINKRCAEIKEKQTHLEIALNIDGISVSQDIAVYVNNRDLKLGFYGRSADAVIDATSFEDSQEQEKYYIQKEKDYIKSFSRIFINKNDLVKLKTNGSEKLRIDAENLASVLKRVIENPLKKEEIIEWLQLLIPEFEDLEISRDNISGIDTLLVKEKHTKEYFRKDLLSDGTYNILSLLTAVYQSDEPQFLCIEEPENGLNPFVIQEMVNLFRQLCEEKSHYIWLNTHSPTLVRELQPKEVILIDKNKGVTEPKQIQHDLKLYSLKLDEAWLSNALGGGLPW